MVLLLVHIRCRQYSKPSRELLAGAPFGEGLPSSALLMYFSGMFEIPGLQAKRKSVMPAPDQSRGQAASSIQCGGGGEKIQNLDSRFRGKDGRGGRLPVDVMNFDSGLFSLER